MVKILKHLSVLIILAIFTATIVRWIIVFLIALFFTPLLLLNRVIEINFQNLATAFTFKFPFLHIDIYPIPFPLVFMNQVFAVYYKNFRFILIFLANILSFLFFLGLIYKLSPIHIKTLIRNTKPKWFDFKNPLFIKRLKIGLSFSLTIILLLVYFVILPGFRMYQLAKETNFLAKQTITMIKTQNYSAADQNLAIIKTKLKLTQQNYKKLGFIRAIPIVKNYYYDVESLLLSADDVLDTATSSLKILPKLKFTSLEEIDNFNPIINFVLNDISKIKEKTGRINPNRYPKSIAGQPVREKIVTIKNLITEIDNDRKNISQLVKIMPEVLGFDSPKYYLVLYQNENEIKPTGGTLTTYGVFQFDKGKILPQGSYEIFNQNLNDSPDFYLSMEKFRLAYPGVRFDGIIALDSQVIADILNVVGPTPVFGRVLTAEKDSLCNCPRVFNDIDSLSQANKKEVIGIILNAVLLKTLSSPPQVLPDLGLTLWQSIKEKHLLFYLSDKEQQKIIESAGMAGRLAEFDGDYLFISETNVSGVKEDRSIKRSVEEKIEITAEGSISKNLVISYQKNLPASQVTKLVLRFYVPLGSKLLENPTDLPFTTFQDLGKTVFEAQVAIKPQIGKRVSIRYQLPFKSNTGNEYRISRQKQPGIDTIDFIIYLNGQKKESFFLNQDRQLTLKI